MSAANGFLRRFPRVIEGTEGPAPAASEPVRPGGHDGVARPGGHDGVVRPGGHDAAPPRPAQQASPTLPGGQVAPSRRGTSAAFARAREDRAAPGSGGTAGSASTTPPSATPTGAPSFPSTSRPSRATPAPDPAPVPREAPTPPAAPSSGGGLLDLFGDEPAAPARPTPAPATAPSPSPASGSGGGLLDLFGDDTAAPPAAPASPAVNPLDLSPELPEHRPASQPAPALDRQGAAEALLDLNTARAAAPVRQEIKEEQHWTQHFPHVRGGWRQDDLRPGPKVIQFDRVQSGTGFLTFSQPEGLGAAGRLQAVAQLSDGRLIGATQGVRNRDPIVDYGPRKLVVHLHLLAQLQRFLVVFTPPQGLAQDAAAVVQMEDEFSRGGFESHVKNLGKVRHVAAYSGFVVDGRLVVRAESRSFTGGVLEPFAAFGYRVGAPQALGLTDGS